MISFEELARFIRIQEQLRRCTYHKLREDGHHKSSEGALSISFNLPPVVGDDRKPYWCVEAYSYLLNPQGRLAQWTGETAGEAIGKAEDAIEAWCMPCEMEMFERQFEPDPHGEFENAPTPRGHSSDDADNLTPEMFK